ncbi:MAG: hypothetical protein K5Q68_17585 [Roseococcus sp.]|nr:hypothetical protein [Roseococcus sp.]
MRFLLLLLALTGPALARPGDTVTLPGEARTGADLRPVRFTFVCSANDGPHVTGVLGVDLEVPHHATLRPVFDFDSFEGPDAAAGRRTRLETTAGGTPVQLQLAVSGSIGVAEDAPFIFSAIAARRQDAARLAELSRLLAPLTLGAAPFTWSQGHARPGGTAIQARLEVSAADAQRLREVLAPCLAR